MSSPSSNNVLVVGGGIVGVFAALRSRQLLPDARIMLVEQDSALGGLLRSDVHSNGLAFDRGTHVLSETGVPTIDSLLFDDLDDAAWRRFGGPGRDLAGLLLDHEVLDGSPFLPAAASCVDMLLARRAAAAEPTNLMEMLAGRFGQELVDAVFREPIRNLYRCELEELDRFVAGQLPLSRVAADDLETWLARSGDDGYRALVACPDQRRLPMSFTSPLKAMYPRKMGIGQLFDKLRPQLDAAGVEVHLGTAIAGAGQADGCLRDLSLVSRERGAWTVGGASHVIWAAPPFQLNKLLGGPAPAVQFKPAWRTVIVDFCARLKRPLLCYYYIDYGNNDGFRLTNYSALSEEAAVRVFSPFTLELWWRGGELNEDGAYGLLARRLTQLGLIEVPEDIADVRLRQSAQGVLFASTQNIEALGLLAEAVNKTAPANLINVGLLSEPRLFFTGDMLRNAEDKLVAQFK